MATNLTPVLSWVATLYAGGAVGAVGASLTVTVNLTNDWEADVPVRVRYGSTISLPTGVFIYASEDGGVTFDTEPLQSYNIAAVASTLRQITVVLSTGQYAIEVRSSSPSMTALFPTYQLIDHYTNV